MVDRVGYLLWGLGASSTLLLLLLSGCTFESSLDQASCTDQQERESRSGNVCENGYWVGIDTSPRDTASPDTRETPDGVSEDTADSSAPMDSETGGDGDADIISDTGPDVSDTGRDVRDTGGANDTGDTEPDADSGDVTPTDSSGTDGDALDAADVRDAAETTGDSDTGMGDGGDTGGPATPEVIFVQPSGDLAFLSESGAVRKTGAGGDIRAIGPGLDHDADAVVEIPYVVDDGTDEPALKVVEVPTGTETVLDPDVMGNTSWSRLGVADLNDDQTLDVVFPDDNNSLAYYSDASGQTKQIVKNGMGGTSADPSAIMAAVDKDGDGKEEVYWLDNSSNVKYVEQGALNQIQSPSFPSIGSNSSDGVGSARDVDSDGTFWWAYIDGSSHPMLRELSGNSSRKVSSGQLAKAPVALGDVDGGSRLEVVGVGTNGHLQYAPTSGSATPASLSPVKSGGTKIPANKTVGVVSGQTLFSARVP